MTELGVCGWCIDRHEPARAIPIACEQLGVRIVQLGFFGSRSVANADAAQIAALATGNGVTLAGSFLGLEGEDYSSIARIGETGGFLPDDVWEVRRTLALELVTKTADFNGRTVAMHVGTIPADHASAPHGVLAQRVREVARHAAQIGIRLLLETGREPVESLLGFIAEVNAPNVGINFDPANLIIYGTDDPVHAVSKLRGFIELVHLKDAFRSPKPGTDFGNPAPFGTGDVQIARVVSKLRATGYGGPLLLEVKGADPLADIRAAIDYLRSMLA